MHPHQGDGYSLHNDNRVLKAHQHVRQVMNTMRTPPGAGPRKKVSQYLPLVRAPPWDLRSRRIHKRRRVLCTELLVPFCSVGGAYVLLLRTSSQVHGAANSVQPHLGTTQGVRKPKCGTQNTRESAKHLLVHRQRRTEQSKHDRQTVKRVSQYLPLVREPP